MADWLWLWGRTALTAAPFPSVPPLRLLLGPGHACMLGWAEGGLAAAGVGKQINPLARQQQQQVSYGRQHRQTGRGRQQETVTLQGQHVWRVDVRL